MLERKRTFIALALACCFALLLSPAVASAQLGGVVHGAKQGVQKGAEGVQKGAEETVDKTKEGARATKNAITGEDNNPSDNQTNTQTNTQTTTTPSDNRMKPGTAQSDTGSTETESSTSTQTKTESTGETRHKQMPKTAGELPLLELTGYLALAGAGLSSLLRRKRS